MTTAICLVTLFEFVVFWLCVVEIITIVSNEDGAYQNCTLFSYTMVLFLAQAAIFSTWQLTILCLWCLGTRVTPALLDHPYLKQKQDEYRKNLELLSNEEQKLEIGRLN